MDHSVDASAHDRAGDGVWTDPAEPRARSSNTSSNTTSDDAHRSERRPAGIPEPGSPFRDALRGATPRPPLPHFAPTCADLEVVMSDVSEVSAWTCGDGPLSEHTAFLLRARDGSWHSVMMGDPMLSTLAPRLRALPGFDTDRMLDVFNARSGQIELLWRR